MNLKEKKIPHDYHIIRNKIRGKNLKKTNFIFVCVFHWHNSEDPFEHFWGLFRPYKSFRYSTPRILSSVQLLVNKELLHQSSFYFIKPSFHQPIFSLSNVLFLSISGDVRVKCSG